MLPDADYNAGSITIEEASRKFTHLYLPEGEPMTLTLKQLMDEVETARTGIHIRHTERMVRDLDRYEKELMPDLARRLKKAMDAMNDAIDSWNKGWDCHSDPGHSRVGKAVFRLAEALNEISYPAIVSAAKKPDTPEVKSVTRNCPKCGFFMTWWPKSNGWYCGTDFLFIPDRNVGPDPNTP